MTETAKKGLSSEIKVGLFFIATLIALFGFARLLGLKNPFERSHKFYVTYQFAGGIEVGSPVRVSGIKVGRVEKIEFFVPANDQAVSKSEPGSGTEPFEKSVVPLKILVSVRQDAARGIRQDSKFYVNIAGIIGERYIEITPGSWNLPQVQARDTVTGIDPPRIDQLLSQSFDLAGKISEIIEKNKGDLTKSLDLIYKLSGQVNQTLSSIDKSAIFKTDLSKLIENLITITSDVKELTKKSRTAEGQKTLDLMYDLLLRLEPLDAKQIRQFLQKEGVKVQLF